MTATKYREQYLVNGCHDWLVYVNRILDFAQALGHLDLPTRIAKTLKCLPDLIGLHSSCALRGYSMPARAQ